MSGRREWIISTLIESDTVTVVQRRHSSPHKPSASALLILPIHIELRTERRKRG